MRHFEFIPNMAIRTAIQTWAPPEIATLRPLAPLHDKAVVDIHRQNSDFAGLPMAEVGLSNAVASNGGEANEEVVPINTPCILLQKVTMRLLGRGYHRYDAV